MSTPATKRELLDLIGEYWNLAHQEGREGRAHDTEDGAAQRTIARITRLVDQLAPDTATQPAAGITLHLPTDEQARAVVAALDLYTRMSLGQFDELAYLMRCGEIKPREDKADDRWLQDVEQTLATLKTLLGHPQSGSFGVGSPKVSASAHRCYELQKVLSRALAMKREPRPDFPYIDYDGLIVRYTQDPAPSTQIITNSKKEDAA